MLPAGVVTAYGNVAAEYDGDRKVAALDFPGVPELKPAVGILHLVAVFDVLLEHAVLVADAVAVARIVQGGKGVQEAGCQAAKATVAQSCVGLLVFYHVIVNVQVLENLHYGILDAHVDEVVAQCPAHEKFSGEVVHLPGGLVGVLASGFHPVGHDYVQGRGGNCVKQVMLAGLGAVLAVLSLESAGKGVFELFLVESHHRSFCP